jgi:hypothetical protein
LARSGNRRFIEPCIKSKREDLYRLDGVRISISTLEGVMAGKPEGARMNMFVSCTVATFRSHALVNLARHRLAQLEIKKLNTKASAFWRAGHQANLHGFKRW